MKSLIKHEVDKWKMDTNTNTYTHCSQRHFLYKYLVVNIASHLNPCKYLLSIATNFQKKVKKKLCDIFVFKKKNLVLIPGPSRDEKFLWKYSFAFGQIVHFPKKDTLSRFVFPLNPNKYKV